MANLTSSEWKTKEHLLCFGCARRITFNVTCNVTALMFFAHPKFQHCEHSNYFVILQKWVPGLTEEDNTIIISQFMCIVRWPKTAIPCINFAE